jgi:hypothetical protein
MKTGQRLQMLKHTKHTSFLKEVIRLNYKSERRKYEYNKIQRKRRKELKGKQIDEMK